MHGPIMALFATVLVCQTASAENALYYEDASLHAVQFVDGDEGWAVGDEGVIWHSIDSGKTWERQASGTRSSLRGVQFLNPYTGWIVGRMELPYGQGSTGIVLFTRDGGLHWRKLGENALPGLNAVRFFDHQTGYAVGEATDAFSTGVFVTHDGGKMWVPVRGQRCPGWWAIDARDEKTATLAGPWSHLAVLRDGRLTDADVDVPAGRDLFGVKMLGDRAVAVGQGGILLLSESAGLRWSYANTGLSSALRGVWDLHAIFCRGQHIWVAGRPGSKILHSADAGKTWAAQLIGQRLPLHGLFFANETHGWAVGDLGTILNTEDGGATWGVQRRGGLQAAAMCIHARPTNLPAGVVAVLGEVEGYLTVGLRATGTDAAGMPPHCAWDGARFAAAARLAGGAKAEMLWHFPLPQHLAHGDAATVLKQWDRLNSGRAAEQMLRQLVLAIRIWRPSVVITDDPQMGDSRYPCDRLVAQAVRDAFTKAGEADTFAEQIHQLGLTPWRPKKLYARCAGNGRAQVIVDLNEPRARLGATARAFAAPSMDLLVERPLLGPAQASFRVLASTIPGAELHRDLMDGVGLAPHGVARRDIRPLVNEMEVVQAIRSRRTLQALADPKAEALASPDRLVSQLDPVLKKLPEDHAAAAALALGNHYARMGQWPIAREIYRLMAMRYPRDSRTAEAYRWLIRHNASSEARRRCERGQFTAVNEVSFQNTQQAPTTIQRAVDEKTTATVRGGVTMHGINHAVHTEISNRAEARDWYQSSVAIGDRLAALGPVFGNDPSIQFCIQSARRNLGDFEGARHWYEHFRDSQPPGPWRDAAAAEVWLSERRGSPPKPVASCQRTGSPPQLDGRFDDACWQDLKPLVLRDAIGKTAKDFATRAWMRYDGEYLYLAVECQHPDGKYVPPVKDRPRDADVRAFDHVDLLLDLDRDYTTYYRLQIDQRGCVCDDCWGDRSWDPHWFVACQSDKTCWRIEAAIPFAELTGDSITVGRTWACNIVRVIPGQGVQAWSVPADVEPRPEAMGLLMFGAEGARVTKAKD